MTPNYFYFPVITSHFFIRLMYAYNQKQYGNTPSNNITFNESAFMSSFNSISSIGNYSITGLDYSIDYSGSGMFVSFIFSCKPDKNNDSEKPQITTRCNYFSCL